MLEVRLIGKFDIQCDGKPVVISSRAAQSLFAYLILHAGTSHRREKLAGMFWPDVTEEKARAYLRHELWRIRKALASKSNTDYFLADDINIGFNHSAEYWLDVVVLKEAGETIEALMTAVSLFQGELLPGFYEEWIILERENLLVVFEQKIACLLELLAKEKRWNDLLEWAERWISFVQSPEVAYRYLMTAYDALGDRAKVAATYDKCIQLLRELDLEPSEQTRALAFKRTSKLTIPIPLTSFIGRERELKEVAELLSKSRLVTLTGSGGVGKTRLAIQVVGDVLERFPDGVWFLDLAPLSDPALIPNTLANLVGLRETDGLPVIDLLKNFFQSRSALVIFDNCEHLIEACAQLVHSLLSSCEHLTILATSREALRVSGEIPYRVPSLEIPGQHMDLSLEELEKIESAQLFIERASVVSASFTIDAQSVQAIAQVCQRLDGIPLAIELAAARANMLTVEQISKRLDDRFHLLTGGLRSALPRHQTLKATIEWSYDLLSEKERLLFKYLAIFAGGWTLEAVEKICSGYGIGSDDVLDLLSQLVNKSLVVVETSMSGTRYRRLETIHQFAREKLHEGSEINRLRDRHLEYFLTKAEEIEPFLTGPEQSAWMDYLDLELDNLRFAMDWAISNKRGEESLRLFGALGWYCYIHCHCREGLEWFRHALELRNGVSKGVQAKARKEAGWLYYTQGDLSAIISLHRENLDFYRELGDMKEIANALQFLGAIEFERENLVQSRAYLEESLDISRRINNKPTMPRVLKQLSYFFQMEGDYMTAWRYCQEALAICRDLQEGHLTMIVLTAMGDLAFAQKNNLQAREYYTEALEICLNLKNKRSTADMLLNFAEILCTEAQYVQSARLQGFAETLLRETESLIPAYDMRQINRVADIIKEHLGEASYRKEFDIGEMLKLEQAVEIALKQ